MRNCKILKHKLLWGLAFDAVKYPLLFETNEMKSVSSSLSTSMLPWNNYVLLNIKLIYLNYKETLPDLYKYTKLHWPCRNLSAYERNKRIIYQADFIMQKYEAT